MSDRSERTRRRLRRRRGLLPQPLARQHQNRRHSHGGRPTQKHRRRYRLCQRRAKCLREGRRRGLLRPQPLSRQSDSSRHRLPGPCGRAAARFRRLQRGTSGRRLRIGAGLTRWSSSCPGLRRGPPQGMTGPRPSGSIVEIRTGCGHGPTSAPGEVFVGTVRDVLREGPDLSPWRAEGA